MLHNISVPYGLSVNIFLFYNIIYDHKTSLKSLGYICSNSQKNMSQNDLFFFYAKNH